ncbi:MAG: COX15/CtaA family protein [Candidatus Zixiibacteriota bacterium]
MKNRWTAFQKLTVLGTAAIYFLIFIGGLVRVSGAGLGCPDWPKCFGRWIPPFNVSQLPEQFDPSQFNFALAWIEYLNRLAGVSIGFIIMAIVITALVKYRSNMKIVIPAVLTGMLTAFQGWQGSRVVASELEPFVISIHMALAFIIASLMIYLTVQAFKVNNQMPDMSVVPQKISHAIHILLIMIIAQVAAGTMVREAFEKIETVYPFLSHLEWLGRVGGIIHFHALLGILILFMIIYAATAILNKAEKMSGIVWQAAWSVMILAFVQTVLGAILMIANLWQVLQVMHMWLSSIILGLMILLFMMTQAERTENEEK